MVKHLVYITEDGVKIWVDNAKRSGPRFQIFVEDPYKKLQPPRLIHLVVDLYVKKAGDEAVSLKLAEHLVRMLKSLKPADSYPPKLQYFKIDNVQEFQALNKIGEYRVEFILVLAELIGIREKTDSLQNNASESVFEAFLKKDFFTVINHAASIPY